MSIQAPGKSDLRSAVEDAVDRVWAEVAQEFDMPRSRQAARRVLEHAILARADAERGSIEEFADAGRRALALKYPWLIELTPCRNRLI